MFIFYELVVIMQGNCNRLCYNMEVYGAEIPLYGNKKWIIKALSFPLVLFLS